MNHLQDIQNELRKAEKIAIFTHTNPDGDALGSSFAMKAVLESLGKTAIVFLEKDIPEKYVFLNQGYLLFGKAEDFDLALSLDCGALSRLGTLEPLFSAINRQAVLDHHISNGTYGDVYYTEPKSAACAELVYLVAKEICGHLPEHALIPLYTGISTDTGHFKFSNVTPRTMEIGAELLRAGLDHRAITRSLYDTVKLSKLKFTGVLADHVKLFDGGQIAVLECFDSFLESYHLAHEDVEELPNTILSIEGVKVSVIIKNQAPDKLKISLRGKENIDLAALASRFGGGGHKCAAGLSTELSAEEITEQLVKEISKELEVFYG